jgi:hypothetical protein
MRRLLLALAPLLLAGCPGPFTRGANAYASATAESAKTLSGAPALLVKSCWKSADVEYLQTRLLRLNAEAKGVRLPSGGDYDVSWEAWREKAHPSLDAKKTWKSYCNEIASTGSAFSTALGGLTAYSGALGALAKDGSYDGADVSKSVDGVNKIVAGLEKSPGGPTKAVGAVGVAFGQFASLILAERVEADIKEYVTKADPLVKALVDALVVYIEAAEKDLDAIASNQNNLLASFELVFGLIPGDAPAAPPAPSAAPAAAPAKANDAPAAKGAKKPAEAELPADARQALAELRREAEENQKTLQLLRSTVALITGAANGSKTIAFYQLALTTRGEIEQTKATLDGMKGVLGGLKGAHAQLLKAGQTAETTDFKTLLGMINDLSSKLQTLKASL